MDELTVPKPYTIQNQTRFLVNNSTLSDVCFMVGDEKRQIYGHRIILALGKCTTI